MTKTTYKNSPLGLIPEDWVVSELYKVVEFLDGKRKPIKETDRSKMQGIYPYYGASGIIDYVNDFIFDEDIILLGEDGANIINRNSPLAFKVSGKVWVNNHAHVLKPLNHCDIGYLTDFLESLKYDKYNTGTAQPKLNKEICKSIPILCPPLQEQTAIANCLSTWDKAIEKQQALIAQKELVEKALMQQLLSGKKRLKGFSEEWKEMRLEYFIKEYKEKPDNELQYEVLTSAKSGLMKQTDYYGNSRITNREDADYNVIPPNYLTYRSRSDDGLFTFNKNNLGVVGLISGYYPVFTIINGDLNFILMYCNYYKEKLIKHSIGSSQLVLSINALKSAKFTLPKIEEQTAIAKVLQCADEELQLLKKKLEQLKEQKKGLMQVLLTGKKRLKY
jgi:type I restriction enzyme S subunit